MSNISREEAIEDIARLLIEQAIDDLAVEKEAGVASKEDAQV